MSHNKQQNAKKGEASRASTTTTIAFPSLIFTLIINLTLIVICLNSPNVVEAFFTSSAATISPEDLSSSSPQQALTSQQRQQHSDGDRSGLFRLSHKSPLHSRQFGDMINDIQIECNSENIVVTLNTHHGFNGMIYPKGLSKNSTCMMEYHQTTSNITYYLPLRSCNTMSSDVEDGVEYFNTVMVQPHRRLVTNQGRGYHIRCRYQTKERTITNQDQQLSVNLTSSTPAVIGSATMPTCSMKIFSANDLTREVAAENVKIGDELQLIISLDDQDVYGMLVTNCLVRDGMNWGEQPLLDDNGCPIDEEIMPQFVYSANLTKASVTFQAHKFPYTSSVYYQCNVRLCFREGGCQMVPPNCNNNNNQLNRVTITTTNHSQKPHFRTAAGTSLVGNELDNNVVGPPSSSHSRHKRWIDGGELDGLASEEVLKASPKSMNLEVYSGLNVDETAALETSADDNGSADPLLALAATNAGAGEDVVEIAATDSSVTTPKPSQQQQQANAKQSERDFCLSLRKFAIAISLISLILMAAIIILIACIIHRRNTRRKLEESQQNAGNIYNNSPYSNRAYCRD